MLKHVFGSKTKILQLPNYKKIIEGTLYDNKKDEPIEEKEAVDL